jgi:shikimate kinase
MKKKKGWFKGKRKIVTLIGMPSARKTSIGRLVAEELGCSFADIDDCIVDYFQVSGLQELVDRLSAKDFALAEESIAILTAMTLPSPGVIATGGSVACCKKAMKYLKKNSRVVRLRASLKKLTKRIAKRPNRGITFKKGETLADLYKRRKRIYKKWAHKTLSTNGNREKVVRKLVKKLTREEFVS